MYFKCTIVKPVQHIFTGFCLWLEMGLRTKLFGLQKNLLISWFNVQTNTVWCMSMAMENSDMRNREWSSNKLNVYIWWATLRHIEWYFLYLCPESKVILFKSTWLCSTLLTYTRGLFFLLMGGISLWKRSHKILRDVEYILAQSKLPSSEEKLWCFPPGAVPPKNSLSSHLRVHSFISGVEV